MQFYYWWGGWGHNLSIQFMGTLLSFKQTDEQKRGGQMTSALFII